MTPVLSREERDAILAEWRAFLRTEAPTDGVRVPVAHLAAALVALDATEAERDAARAEVAALRTALSAWLTLALDGGRPTNPLDGPMLALRDWIDGGCAGDAPLAALAAAPSETEEGR